MRIFYSNQTICFHTSIMSEVKTLREHHTISCKVLTDCFVIVTICAEKLLMVPIIYTHMYHRQQSNNNAWHKLSLFYGKGPVGKSGPFFSLISGCKGVKNKRIWVFSWVSMAVKNKIIQVWPKRGLLRKFYNFIR